MDENASSKIKVGLVRVFIANVINLVINLLTNFLLPKYLSVDSYAALKTYHLYVAYSGVLSFGFVDGMFLKYGGIDFNAIDYKDLNKNISTFRIFQTVIVGITFIVAFALKDIIIIAFAIATLPINMSGYFRSLYQAIGEFKKYSSIMNATTVTTFVINILLLFVVRTDNYSIYLCAYVLLNLVIWFILEYFFYKSIPVKFKLFVFSGTELIGNVKDGFLLMLGNFANTIFTSMDRWFIKVLMSTAAFAQYSFACSMENFINVAVTPITVTLYNYFCKVNDANKIKKIRNSVIILGAFLISSAFPGKFILELFLTEYIEASEVMFYLFAAQLYYIIIKSIYVNLYKSRHLQTRYFIKLVSAIIVGFCLNFILYKLFNTKEAFAIATLISAIIWFILSVTDFPDIKILWREILFLTIATMTFIACGVLFGSVIGFLIYVIVVVVLSLTLMKKDLLYLINVILNMLKKKIRKSSL